MNELSHVDEAGAVRMVNVGAKPLSRRRATARGAVRMAAETSRRLHELPKGDALTTAQLAGIMAAKRTSELIPLCHPLPLSSVAVSLRVGDGVVEIEATVETTAQTGVEMEALTAVAVAGLTVYDMAKAIDKGMSIDAVTLVEKTKDSGVGSTEPPGSVGGGADAAGAGNSGVGSTEPPGSVGGADAAGAGRA